MHNPTHASLVWPVASPDKWGAKREGKLIRENPATVSRYQNSPVMGQIAPVGLPGSLRCLHCTTRRTNCTGRSTAKADEDLCTASPNG